MKKRLTHLLLFISLAFQAIGQNNYSLQTSFTNTASGFFQSQGKLYLKGQWQNTIGHNTVGLQEIKFFKDSISLTPKIEISGEAPTLNHFIAKKSGVGFIGIGYENGCRYLASGNYFYHFDDALKQNRKKTRITYFFRNIAEPIKYAFFLDDITLVLANNDVVVTFNIQTSRATFFNDSLSEYTNLIPFEKGFVAIEGEKFHLFNSNCNVVGTQFLGFNPVDLIKLKTGNGFIAIGQNKVAVLNRSGSEIYEHSWDALKTSFDSLESVFYHKDTLNLLGYKDGFYQLAQTTDQFGILSLTVLSNVKTHVIKDVTVKGNHIYALLSQKEADQSIDELHIFKRTNALQNKSLDIALRALFIDSIISHENKGQLHAKFYGTYLVENYSADTISTFFINWKSSNEAGCLGPQSSTKYNRPLAPLATDTLQFAFADSFLVPQSLYDLCVSVSSPNGFTDTATSNNSACSFEFLPPLSLKNQKLNKIEMPTMAKLGTRLPVDLNANYTLIDLSGKAIPLLHNSIFVEIPINLHVGVYVLLIQTQEFAFSNRLLLFN